jgi:hypothetical protein
MHLSTVLDSALLYDMILNTAITDRFLIKHISVLRRGDVCNTPDPRNISKNSWVGDDIS